MSLLEFTRPHFVYYLEVQGEVVYVGRSVSPVVRWRIFQRKTCVEAKLGSIVEFNSFEEAANFERAEIVRLSPLYNKYVASSPSRLGFKNTPKHRVALGLGAKNAIRTKESGKKRWENRSRALEDNVWYGKHHTEASKEKIRLATKSQFEDPVKREKHRAAMMASIAERKAKGIPMGRYANKLKEKIK